MYNTAYHQKQPKLTEEKVDKSRDKYEREPPSISRAATAVCSILATFCISDY